MNIKLLLSVVVLSAPFLCCTAQTKKSKKQKGKITAVKKEEVVVDTVPVVQIPQDRLDTIYYDNNWRTIKNKVFASYYRYALYPVDSLASKKSRTFYITGELEGEGDFIELSALNDKQSKFTGLYTHYYKSGTPSSSYNYSNGVLNGEYVIYNETGKPSESGAYNQGVLDGKQTIYFENGDPSKVCHYQNGATTGLYTTYYESGLIHEYVNMRDGKRDGIESVFSENGEICTQSLYVDGKRSDQYMITDKRGNCTLYKTADNSPIFVAPTLEEMNTEYKNGVAWPYYNKNGLIIGVSQVEDDEVGSYKELQFFLSNNSMNNVDIDPATISAYTIKKDERKDFPFMDSEEYYKKITSVH
ncbi:MAG: toxin-antitoxin system YwqK family antitoxin [Bacteroides sp.]|nr:toxin-antitoxin system YwqK family antitoxin [Bacteroides sp.]